MGFVAMQTTVRAAIAHHRGTQPAFDSLRVVAAVAGHLCSWATAAEGRRRTEHVLRALDRTAYQVLNHVELPGSGPVNHVVIGPGGIYVIDSKVWHGVVTVDQKGATITPTEDPDAAWTARGRQRSLPHAAAVVARGLTATTGSALPAPCAVVVVWAPFPERVAVSGGVTYVAGEQLSDWLAARREQLEPRRLATVPTGALTSVVPQLRSPRARQPM